LSLSIIIITGYSGSGISSSLAALEDAGFYCVDNLPVVFLTKFLELPIERGSDIAGLAFGMDVREKGFIEGHAAVFADLRKRGIDFKIIFLEAAEAVLVQRYKETRRHHPLSRGRPLVECIRNEKDQLRQLREEADLIINTTHLSVHQLKAQITDIARRYQQPAGMHILLMSFGFKFGLPAEADMVTDVRFVTNPYFVPELKALDGEAEPVADFVLAQPETTLFLKKYIDLLDYLLPLYEKEGKKYLTLAVGCTGGRHRSMPLARHLYRHWQAGPWRVELMHREIHQPQKTGPALIRYNTGIIKVSSRKTPTIRLHYDRYRCRHPQSTGTGPDRGLRVHPRSAGSGRCSGLHRPEGRRGQPAQ